MSNYENMDKDLESDNLMVDTKKLKSSSLSGSFLYEPLFPEINMKKQNIFKRNLNCSFIMLFFIILTLFAIAIVIYYIIVYQEKSNYYTFKIDWNHSYLNKREYLNYHFDNGLEVMLINDKDFEMDGGAVVINKGYMNNPYDEGIATFASLLLDYYFNKTETLNNYFGSYSFETEDFYTNFEFEILNSGFKKFLVIFGSVLNDEKIPEFFKNVNYSNLLKIFADTMLINYQNNIDDIDRRENHLIEYLVYNFKNENNNDILPEGNNETIYKYSKTELEKKTIKYIKKLINPNNIKIVLFSKYKFLVSSKYMIKSFQYLINKKYEEPEKDSDDENDENIFDKIELKKSQIIYMKCKNYETNYIKIIYYIDKINNESFSELYYKTNYLNYITDILSEKKENSLYYLLTHNSNFNIKSILGDYDLILNSKIIFYIFIELNCLENINDIIFITYQYMDKIVKEGIGENMQMDRYLELQDLYNRRVLYTEKSFDTKVLAKNNGENIFMTKYNQYYYFYNYWCPWERNMSYEDNIKKVINESYLYFTQLKPENSVIILGLRDNDKDYITCNNYSYFPLNCSYFKDANNIKTTKYYNLEYINTTFNSSDFEKYFDINNTANISYVKNRYISKHNEEIQESNESQSYSKKSNNTLNTFHFKKDPTFLVPKLYISINLLHPYLRPLLSDRDKNECYYFQILEIFSAIKRKINEELADAIRAFNEITIDYNENYLYINIYCYEDIAYEIVKTIKNIIFDIKWEKTDFIINNKMYKHETLENFFNFDIHEKEEIAKYYFYCQVKNGLFNKYEFNRLDFDLKYDSFCFENIINNLNNLNRFIVNGLIYGNYNNLDADKIYDLFQRKEIFLEEKGIIQQLLNEVNNNIEVDEYEYWTKEIKELEKDDQSVNININIISKADHNYGFRFISLFNGDFNNTDYLYCSLLENMFNNIDSKYSENLDNLKIFIYRDIYFGLILYEPDDIQVNPNNNSFVAKLFDTMIEESNNYYSFSVDNIGDRFYYLQKNLGLIIFKKQNTFGEKAVEEINYRIYNYTLLNPDEILNEFNNNNKKVLVFENLKEFFNKRKNGTKFDVNTADSPPPEKLL